MKLNDVLGSPVFAYEYARSAFFAAEFSALNVLAGLYPNGKSFQGKRDAKLDIQIQKAVSALFKKDSGNIRNGLYPLSVLAPESAWKHVSRIPALIYDGYAMQARRMRGKTAEFASEDSKDLLDELPRYYRRNFHFQTDGYLSPQSAKLYEHQVEMLFGGTADAMRRLIIAPLREKFGQGSGQGLSFLEIGAGTGRATKFVRLAFPKAKIVAVDLSDPYLKLAQKNLKRYPRVDFLQADGTKLPFQAKEFDAVFSVFLFHELPLEVRKSMLQESHRVLKSGGFLGFVDSIQTADHPAFDSLLSEFPMNYHEPYFRNYLENPMEDLLKNESLREIKTDFGFFSKVCWGLSGSK